MPRKRKREKNKNDGDNITNDKCNSKDTNGNSKRKGSKNGGGKGKGRQRNEGNRNSNRSSSNDNQLLWQSTTSQNRSTSSSSKNNRARPPSYIDRLKSGEKSLDNTCDAQQFFKILSRDYNDGANLALKFDETMSHVIEKATNLLHPDLSEPLKLLAVMGGEALIQGVYKERTLRCFKAFYGATDFMLTLTSQMTTGRLQGPKDHSTIAWFILQLGKTGNEDVLNDPLVKEQIEFLKTSTQVGFPQLSNQLQVVFQFNSSQEQSEINNADTGKESDSYKVASLDAAQKLMRPPGVRDHDNDKENFRSISIIPTTMELQCKESAYLPSTSTPLNIDTNPEAAALDRQFRLMREDLLGTVKEELQEELKLVPNQRRRILPDPFIVNFGMQPEPHVVVRVSIPHRISQRIYKMKNSEAQKFFSEGSGKRVLQRGTLVLLVCNTSVLDQGNIKSNTHDPDIQISAVGTIVERKDPMKIVKIPGSDPVKCKRVLEVGVSFTPESMRAIMPLLQSLENRNVGVPMLGTNGGLFNASAGFFSLEPILKALIKIDQIPMSEQLIYLKHPRVPALAHGGKCFSHLSSKLQEAVISDAAQKRAMDEMFKSNTVLVQGPPGTGKTYIGVQMVKAMLEFDQKVTSKFPPLRILCLCYTNHALDSFLLDLLAAGVPKELFIRLGSSPKIDPKIKSRCLGELEEAAFGRAERAAYGAIKQESEKLEIRMKQEVKNIAERSKWGKSESWWKQISEWLEEHYYEELEQLKVPDTTDADGFEKAGKKNKALKSNYLWERWCNGKGKGIFQDDTAALTGIWKLRKSERYAMIQTWNQEWIDPQLDLLASTMKSLQENMESLRLLRQTNDLKLLKNAKIVGCTTVGAAKYQGMINPSAVIVEEAGEILESHVLANIGSSCEQLIMIGDHKQLRPKIDNYRLQKESRNGYDLNISLFERLVVAPNTEIPVIPLKVQHRMRPEISRIIRGMGLYEELEDHKNTRGRCHVSGVATDVLFLDHQYPEKLDEATAAVGMATKVNLYEVDMVVSICKYIIQQGQFPLDQVTILTPYLGQLSLIRKKLDDTNIGSYISDQDFSDLVRHDLNDISKASEEKKRIRIATVDNFQGEESDVIVVSLVRSNPRDGRIGFLASPERVNVLFSRARKGMYIVGNLQTLSQCASKQGRELWSNIRDQFNSYNQRLDYFPAKCQRHNSLTQIRTPEDFLLLAPEGGCAIKCNMILPCNHTCPLKCHGNSEHVHSMIMCKEKVEDVCSNGHRQLRECSSTVKCTKTMKWFCPRGHSILGLCRQGRPKTCKTCNLFDKLEEEARERELNQEQEMIEQEQDLLAMKLKLSAALKDQEHKSKQEMIKREQMLVDKNFLEVSTSHKTDDLVVGSEDMDLSNSDKDDQPKEYIEPSNPEKDTILDALSTSTIERKNVDLSLVEHIQRNDRNSWSSQDESQLEEESIDSRGSKKEQSRVQISVEKESPAISYSTHSADKDSLLKNADFCDAIKRFEAKKFLEADDLIDNCLNNKQCKGHKKTLEAFRYIVQESLDPSEEKWQGTNCTSDKITSFEAAIECWASFLSLASTDFPFVAKEQADSSKCITIMLLKLRAYLRSVDNELGI